MHKMYRIGGLAGFGAVWKEFLLTLLGLFTTLLAMPSALEAITVTNSAFQSVDASFFTRTFVVSGASTITDVDILIDFSKCDDPAPGPTDPGCLSSGTPFNNEIVFQLTSPNGTPVTVVDLITAGTYPTGVSGARVIITFDDAATASVGGPSPQSGRFKPVGALAAFNGQNPNGTWTLKVQDTVGADPLQFYSATLCINQACPTMSAPNTSTLIGDVDADGDRDAVDASLVLQVLVGLNPSTAIRFASAGDVNADGFIDNRDSSLILAIEARRPGVLPPPEPSLIQAHATSNGFVTVTGSAGAVPPAVPPNSTVNLLNIINGATTSVLAASNGSFGSTLAGVTGDTIVIDINGSPARAAITVP